MRGDKTRSLKSEDQTVGSIAKWRKTDGESLTLRHTSGTNVDRWHSSNPPMNTITFSSHSNFLAFMDMAEGMWLNYRDDNQEPDLSIVDRLHTEINAEWTKAIDRTRGTEESQYPMTLPLSTGTVEMAQSVLENCVDYTRDGDYLADPEESVIIEGEVTIV